MRVAAGDAAAERRRAAFRFNRPTKPTIVVDDADPRGRGRARVGRGRPGARRRAACPLGYYNDPEKTAATFVEVDGERWLVTGDMATVERRRRHRAAGPRLGRASTPAARRSSPKRSRASLKAHPAVYDVLVVGVPDERWGSAVTAVVQPVAGRRARRSTSWPPTAKATLAGYKAPEAPRRGRRRRALAVGQGRLPLGQGDGREVGARSGPRRRAPATRRCGGPGTAPRWPAAASRAPCRAPAGSSPGWA